MSVRHDAPVDRDVPFDRVAVVHNPTKVDLDALQKAVSESAGDTPVEWLETDADDNGLAAAKRALDNGADLLLAAGGDGTIRACAQAVSETDASFAIVPAGTGNLLARNLGVPLQQAAAVRNAFAGTDKVVDLGRVTLVDPHGEERTETFMVAVGIGIDAQMVDRTDDDAKAKAGWLAYIQGIVSAFIGTDHVAVRLRMDGGSWHTNHAHTVMVGNCGLLPGNVVLLPDAEIDDGLLDVAALRPRGAFGWLQIVSKVIFENGLLRRTEIGRKITARTSDTHALRYLQGEVVEIQFREPQLAEIDGDLVGEVRGFRCEVKASALRVRVPA